MNAVSPTMTVAITDAFDFLTFVMEALFDQAGRTVAILVHDWDLNHTEWITSTTDAYILEGHMVRESEKRGVTLPAEWLEAVRLAQAVNRINAATAYVDSQY